MTNKIISAAALATFGLFIGVLLWWVPHLDLIVIMAIGFVLCAYDFWQTAWSTRSDE